MAGTEPGPHSLSKASTTSAASIKPTKKTASQPPRALTSCTIESRLRGVQTTPSARRQHSSHVTVMGLQTMRHPCLPACMTACLPKTIMPAPPVVLLLLVGGRCCILPEEQTGLFQAPAADMCPAGCQIVSKNAGRRQLSPGRQQLGRNGRQRASHLGLGTDTSSVTMPGGSGGDGGSLMPGLEDSLLDANRTRTTQHSNSTATERSTAA